MKKLSLQFKITLLCTIVLGAACVLLTVSTMIFSSRSLFGVAKQATVAVEQYVFTTSDLAVMEAAESLKPAVTVKSDLFFQPKTITDEVWADTGNLQNSMFEITSAASSQIQVQIIALMVVILVLGTLGIYWIVARMTRPLRQLTTSIGSLDEEKLSVRLEENGIREVAELSHSLNQMIGRLDEAFERQKRFTADAAHELKTPLASIQVNLDSLRQDENFTAEEAAEVLQVTQRNIRRLNQLAENLLQLNSCEVIEKSQRCSVHDTFCTIIEELDPLIRQKNLKVVLADSYPCLMSEPSLLLRCCYNCLENAVKYTAPETVIRIDLEKAGDEVRITIANPCAYISELQCSQLFQPFFRLDASRSRKLGGSGLGLAITQEIIHRLDGDIHAEWEDGEFRIRILLPS